MDRSMSNRNVIVQTIHTMIRSWLEGDIKRITDIIDEEVVMYCPQSGDRVVGKRAFTRALEEFRRHTDITRYDESDFMVDTRGGISVATYHFHIEYATGNDNVSESGIDLLVFQRKGATWKLVRRSMLPSHQGTQ